MPYEDFINQYKTTPSGGNNYNQFINQYKIAVDDEGEYDKFIGKYATTKKRPFGAYTTPDKPFAAKHPITHAVGKAALSIPKTLSKVAWLKYIYPEERKKFMELTGHGKDATFWQPKTQKQAQVRALLLADLEYVILSKFKPIVKGVKPVVAETMKKYLPKTYKYFTKARGAIKIGGGKPPKKGLRVASIGADGKIYYGEQGELHHSLSLRFGGKIRKVAKLKSGEATWEKIGWTDRSGKFLTREEALKGATVKPSIKGELDALDYREQVIESPVQKVIGALKEATSKRKVQEQIYHVERSEKLKRAMAAGEKVTGEKRFIAMKKELKGKMTKVEFESLREKIGQKEQDALFEILWKSPEIRGYENATAFRGLAKMLDGTVPQDVELGLLGRAFPKELIRELIKKRALFQRMKEGGLQLANIPRSVMASFDLSAPFRQGLMLISHPKRFGQSFIKMFRQFGSEKAFNAVQEAIVQKPTYGLMEKAGLQLTKLGRQMSLREEGFMSQWAEKIPLVGRVIRASGRAHMGFLNKLRADVFEDLVNKAVKLGRDPHNNMDLLKEMAHFVNAASGRGKLGALESSATTLNALLFSPRLIASRLTFLNPAYYIKADPLVRKEALRSLFAVSGMAGTVIGLAKAGGAEVGLDPRSADFLKIKIGNTRIDLLGGFQQYMRAAGQLISGKYVSSTTGKILTIGEGYKPITRLEIIERFVKSKLAPISSFVVTLLEGREPMTSKPISVPKEIGKRFIPMAMADIYEIAKESPELLPVSWLGIFGVGIQTYAPRPKKARGIGGIGGIK